MLRLQFVASLLLAVLDVSVFLADAATINAKVQLSTDYGTVLSRVKRQLVIPGEQELLRKCAAYEDHGLYSHARLHLIWHRVATPAAPMRFLRDILADDLDLPELTFTVRQYEVHGNKMIFEMSRNTDAYAVLHNYCELLREIDGFRTSGYNDPLLSYEIAVTEENFTD